MEPPDPELTGLLYVCRCGSANSKLKESMSLQKASFNSASDVSLGSIEVRRLLLRVSFGAMEIVALTGSVPLTTVSADAASV